MSRQKTAAGGIPAAAAPFTDCDPGAWYAEALSWAYEGGLIEGYDWRIDCGMDINFTDGNPEWG